MPDFSAEPLWTSPMPHRSVPYPVPCAPASDSSLRSRGVPSRWPCSVPLPGQSDTGPRRDDRGCRLSSRRSPCSRSHLVWLLACSDPMLARSMTVLEECVGGVCVCVCMYVCEMKVRYGVWEIRNRIWSTETWDVEGSAKCEVYIHAHVHMYEQEYIIRCMRYVCIW